MSTFDVPSDIGVSAFFEGPCQTYFENQTRNADVTALLGKVFTLQYNVDHYKYCLKIENGNKLEVIEGGVEKPMICLALGESDWRDNITEQLDGGLKRFIDPVQILDPDRYEKLVSISGTLQIRPKKKNGKIMPVDIIFNGADTPSVKLKLKLKDWVAIQQGKKNGATLLLTGRMRVSGDLGFLLKCQALL